MKIEAKAIIESTIDGGYSAICPKFPGANRQGKTIDEANESLRAANTLSIEDPLDDCLRGLVADAVRVSL